MGSIWLYAIAIDEVREIFSANPGEAAALRAIAADRFLAAAPARTGLLGKIGPLFRHDPAAPVQRADVPEPADWERLLAGHYIPPHRVQASWLVLRAWLSAKSWSHHRLVIDRARVEEVDFALSRAGAPVTAALQSQLSRDLGLPLRPAPGMAAGYSRGSQVLSTLQSWRITLPSLDEGGAEPVRDLLGWLENFATWTRTAAESRRQPPDLICIWVA